MALALGAALQAPAWADGLDSLAQFAAQVRSGQASFTQVVTPPGKDGKPGAPKTQSGQFAFERPGKFRFDYQKPFAQTIVADGQTLWLYDADLNQVTRKAQAQVLGSTPAAIVSSANNLDALRKDFELKALPDAEAQQWVLATPKNPDGQIKSVRVGLKPGDKGPQLQTLDITDNFGQRSVITFGGFESNAALPAATFQFKPPAGADVLKE
ncbi:outer membrane lipoprotein chaperone LolA [Comamonas serinivorans]|nr:outer membrane lipoprotein chaperone LolA [Comamonas serinivorans]